jgi:transposase-like protein
MPRSLQGLYADSPKSHAPRKLLKPLTEELREAIVHETFERGLSQTEVAKSLGVSRHAVKRVLWSQAQPAGSIEAEYEKRKSSRCPECGQKSNLWKKDGSRCFACDIKK